MVPRRQQADKTAQQKQPENKEAGTANKKVCLNAKPKKMKQKDGNLMENATMTGDIAVAADVDDDKEDTKMDEVTVKLDEVFDLPDIIDKKFWASEIKYQTDEYAHHCHKLEKLEGCNKGTLWAEGPLCGTALMHAGHSVLNTGGKGIIEVEQWVELFRNSMKP